MPIWLLLVLLGLTGPCAARDTKMVIGLHRHGARYSTSFVETPENKGMLTLNGHRMAYLLGKFIRSRAPGFFGDRMKYEDTFVYASALPRTRRTAQSVLMGIYDLGSQPEPVKASKFTLPEWDGPLDPIKFDSALPAAAQPVPIHSFLEFENFVFEPDREDVCPRIRELLKASGPPDASEFLAAINAFLPKLRNPEFDYRKFIDKPALTSLQDYVFSDYIISQRYLGHSLGLSEEEFLHFERMDILNDYMSTFRDRELSRYMFTEMSRVFRKHLEDLQRDLASTPEKDIKRFALFSGHDVNLYLMLMIANLVQIDCLKPEGKCTINPRYASLILMEVYLQDGQAFVESTYNGERVPICPTADGKDCTLGQFIARLKEISLEGEIDELRSKYCFKQSRFGHQMRKATWFLAFVAVIAGGAAWALWRRTLQSFHNGP